MAATAHPVLVPSTTVQDEDTPWLLWLSDHPVLFILTLLACILVLASAGFGVASFFSLSLFWSIILTVVGAIIGFVVAVILLFLTVLLDAYRQDQLYGH